MNEEVTPHLLTTIAHKAKIRGEAMGGLPSHNHSIVPVICFSGFVGLNDEPRMFTIQVICGHK